MKDFVKAMLLRGTNALLARRSSGRRNYPDRWSFPGGHVETGETLDDTLVRELQEEIKLTPLVFWKIGEIIEPNPMINCDVLYHMYAVNAWAGGEPSIVGNEHSEIRWFGIHAAAALQHLALAEYLPILRTLL